MQRDRHGIADDQCNNFCILWIYSLHSPCVDISAINNPSKHNCRYRPPLGAMILSTGGNIVNESLQAYIWSLRDLGPSHMMTSSNGNIFHVTGPLCGKFTDHRWIPRAKASEAELWCFLWSAPWMNGWANNREAGDLRRHRAHNDVIVMPPNLVKLVTAGVRGHVLRWC